MALHDDLYPYPTDLNTPAKILLSKLTGGDVDTACAAHAAYQILGVGLGAALPHDHPPVIFGGVSKEEMTDEECEKVLRTATAARGEAGGLIPDALKKQLLQVALTLLLKWLGA